MTRSSGSTKNKEEDIADITLQLMVLCMHSLSSREINRLLENV